VNFKNTIIIMTSNVGSQHLRSTSRFGFATEEEAANRENSTYRGKVMDALKKSFRPEFLNRIDEIVVFNPLTEKEIEKIVDMQVGVIQKRLAEHKIQIEIDAAARQYLAKEGFDPDFGARPLKRLMHKMILDRLADKIIRGELKDGGKVKVNFKNNSLVFAS
jgi:ATP-dependent Clp protease ATP-binding subunit ClpA